MKWFVIELLIIYQKSPVWNNWLRVQVTMNWSEWWITVFEMQILKSSILSLFKLSIDWLIDLWTMSWMYFVDIDKPINQRHCHQHMPSIGVQLWHRENNTVYSLSLLIDKYVFRYQTESEWFVFFPQNSKLTCYCLEPYCTWKSLSIYSYLNLRIWINLP